MSNKYIAGIISSITPTTTGGKTGIASGIWTQTQAAQRINSATFPIPKTVPSAPTIGTAVVVSSTSATVSFTPPADNGGSAITIYTATSSPSGITGTSTGLVTSQLTSSITKRLEQ